MGFDDFFTNRQPEAAARGFGGKIGFKNPVAYFRRDTAAVVADLYDRLVSLTCQGNMYVSAPVGRNGLYSIDNQVIKHTNQVVFITQDMETLLG